MKKKILSLMLVLTVLFSSIGINSRDICAADGTVKIFLGDSTTARHHKAIVEGSRSEELSFKLKEGTVKTSSFSSDNPKSFQIIKENGKTYIEGIKEGVGYVTLNVETTDGDKYKERLFISVYKETGTYIGLMNTKAEVYRGASANANVENLDKKGELQKNTKVYVVAKCDKYYLIRTIDGFQFEDNKDTGFVKKSTMDIPISKIELNKNNLTINKEEDFKFTANVYPSFTTENKFVTWSTSNKNNVVVYKDGNIYAKNIGESILYAKAGSVIASCKITIKEQEKDDVPVKKSKSKKLKAKLSKKYRYSFLNSGYAFGEKYKLSSNLRKKLAKELVELGYYKKYSKAKKAVKKILKGKWGGSCYGMVITIALNKKKQINVRKYTKSNGDGYQLNKVEIPLKNKKVGDIINYYYASQAGMSQDEPYYTYNNKEGLKNLVKNAKNGYVESFGFYMWKYEENPKTHKKKKVHSGHQLLLLGYSKKKSNKKWHAIKCYDCSYDTADRYVFVSKKYNKIKIQGWSKNYTIEGFDCSLDFGRFNKIKLK